jgi:hypothetical protein
MCFFSSFLYLCFILSQKNGQERIVGILGLVLYLSIRRSRKSRENENETEIQENQQQVLAEFETNVFALLNQYGEPMRQTDICRELGLPVEIVAERLREMEKNEEIYRRWSGTDYTYAVEKGNNR